MTAYDNFIASLAPKIKKDVVTANSVKTIRHPVASKTLTYALNGGIAEGRIVTIYGNQSAGKTMLTLQTIAKLQKEGKVCGFVDVEGTFDNDFAESLGVDTSKLILSRKKSAGRVTDEVVEWIKAGIDFVAIDSISDLMPDVFLDKSEELKLSEDRKQIGAHAKAVKTLISGIHYVNEKTAVVLLSQTTTEIAATYVKQIPMGGKSLLFNSTQIIRLTSSNTDAKQIKGLIQMGDLRVEQPIGRKVDAFVEKNKLGRQSTTASYDIYYGGDSLGIDLVGELVDMCVDFGVINKTGAWFNYGETKWQGRDSVITAVKNDEQLELALNERLDEILYG